VARPARAPAGPAVPGDGPLWYKDAIVYEVHVRAFSDSDGDGIGDFRGLTEKLDYLQDLGVTALWLLPFYPSPLRDDGYDIADYTGIHPAYGTMRSFQTFLREAHRRGLRVITELVLNHTSDQHPWFQRARREPPGSRWRDFYVWSETPDRYREARIILKDFESSNWAFDPAAKAYYWHRFYTHQPDLNYDSPDVRRAMLDVVECWLGQEVDGLRLDAVPYLYEREGTTCENLPETHAFLKALRRHIDERFPNRMLLAEANQWPEDAIAYFGGGDECHMAFHFPLMPRLFMAIHMEDRFPIVEILQQTPPIPEPCQWALFLRNHDELTLEMVTDEDRDYMYRVYAQDPHARVNLGIRRRLAPLMRNNRRRIELMNGLLFSIPGTPILYYGDEIGMGDNIYLGDRNGVRTPMQWSSDRNAGFSRANPQQLYLPVIIDPEYHYETVNVEAQQRNPHSLLWWMKRLVALRKRYRAFGRGTLEFLQPENRKVLAFLRRYEGELILVVANLSRFVQYVELNLAPYRGMVPVELFGRTEFPAIGDLPYFLTLGPHAFYWFALEPQRVPEVSATPAELAARLPALAVQDSWEDALQGPARPALEAALGAYLPGRRWFSGKARRMRAVRIQEALRMPYAQSVAYIVLVQVDYTEGDSETYVLPLTFAGGNRAEQVRQELPQVIVARLRAADAADGVLYEALGDREFCTALLLAIARRRRLRGAAGEVASQPTPEFRRALAEIPSAPEPQVLKADQSNTSVLYGDQFILKLFRRLEPGQNPELELGRFLTGRLGFAHVPPVAGAIEYRVDRGEPLTLAILERFVPNEGDAWRYTLDVLGHYYDRVVTSPGRTDRDPALLPPEPLPDLAGREIPQAVQALIGEYLPAAQLLGQRTAELHAALASDRADPAFAPEALTPHDQRSLYQAVRSLARQTLHLLRRGLRDLPEAARPDAQRLLDGEEEILRRARAVLERRITGVRIRCHGDYHLGQVLHTGKDFVIIDLEGEPGRPLGERRIKRPPLRDVAGMLRSFHYAAQAALLDQVARGVAESPEALGALEWGARIWRLWVSVAFLKGYLPLAGRAEILPAHPDEVRALLDVHLLEKALYELGYELNHRPEWVRIPLAGVLEMLGARPGSSV
jgi:maltose alpha-D-glucosyltransferase/alpha-amylase